MGSFGRKIRRKQRRDLQKAMKKQNKQIEERISKMPKACDECGAPFDRSKTQELDQWRIAAYDDGRVRLVCPKCVPDSVKEQ